MKTVGLITEYNPFHNGHAYHIEKAKMLTGAATSYNVVLLPSCPNTFAPKVRFYPVPLSS